MPGDAYGTPLAEYLTLFRGYATPFVADHGGDDTLTGGYRDDVLKGRGGDDVLDGGRGSDRLAGGRGADEFQFSAKLVAGEVDTIRDFAPGKDTIVLSGAVFAALTTAGSTRRRSRWARRRRTATTTSSTTASLARSATTRMATTPAAPSPSRSCRRSSTSAPTISSSSEAGGQGLLRSILKPWSRAAARWSFARSSAPRSRASATVSIHSADASRRPLATWLK